MTCSLLHITVTNNLPQDIDDNNSVAGFELIVNINETKKPAQKTKDLNPHHIKV